MVEKILIGVTLPFLGAALMQENILIATRGNHPYLPSGFCDEGIHHSRAAVNGSLNFWQDVLGLLAEVDAPVFQGVFKRFPET
jgi:hypothetical protein